jgi:hypothetical protein
MRSMRVRLVAIVIAVAVATSVGATPADATTTVTIDSQAKLVADGSVIARVTVTCDPGREVLEAHLTISQDDQRISGTSGISRIRCDNRPHKVKVRVTPLEGSFHVGDGFASAFILRYDPNTGETEQGQDSRSITVR